MRTIPARSFTVALGTVLVPALLTACQQAPTDAEQSRSIAHAPPGACSPWPECKDGDDGGNDDGGGGGSDEVSLQEYWYHPGEKVLHMAGTGDVSEVSPNPAYDYFFNGRHDDDDSDHYEYFESLDSHTTETLDDGSWHVDVAWDGEMVDPYDAATHFADRLAGGRPDVAWDPFIFHTAYATGDGGTCCFDPSGVMDDGEVLAPSVDAGSITASGHSDGWLPSDSVRSYAQYETSDTGLGEVWVEGLSVTDATCTLTNTGPGNSGKGDDVSRIELAVELTVAGDAAPDTWAEFHIANAETGERSSRITESFGSGENPATLSTTLAHEFSGHPADGDLQIQLQLDYVHPTSTVGLRYDPGQNSGTGGFLDTSGFTTESSTSSSVVGEGGGSALGGSWPVAHVEGTVTCS